MQFKKVNYIGLIRLCTNYKVVFPCTKASVIVYIIINASCTYRHFTIPLRLLFDPIITITT
jgi:hypothetical protein